METIIVIGAGAAGLMAACELSKKNKVVLLEAADRLGGRIYTSTDNSFSVPVELGAEFIHGNLPVTLNLLKKAGIKYNKVKGEMLQLKKGKIKKENSSNKYWNEVMQQMKKLEQDMPLSEFLQQYFSGEKYEDVKRSVIGMAEGFDLADVLKASTISLYNEWADEDHVQYRIEGGYQQLINYLESECKKNGVVIYNNCCVKKINWSKNEVNVITLCSRFFKSDKVVITVPLSVLQADKNDIDYIEFTPSIDNYLNAAKSIGFGTVIKIIFEFDEAFWKTNKKNVGFILTEEIIPVWWTQLPDDNSVLTGWLGGSKAVKMKNIPDEELLNAALQSLASAFEISVDMMKKKLKVSKVINWHNMPRISGGYSYNLLNSFKAKKILGIPIDDTIFFAGEALFDGVLKGTVEAALVSGKQTALKILNS